MKKIKRYIDCACSWNGEYICRYHWNKIKWRGAILGIGISTIIFGTMWYSPSVFLGLIGIGAVAFFIKFFIEW